MKLDPFYEAAASAVADLMETHGAGWVVPWFETGQRLMNGVSGHRYRGFNTLILACAMIRHGWTDPRFVGFQQASAIAGPRCLKGRKAVHVLAPIVRKSDDGEITVSGYRGAAIFNVEQVEGIDLEALKPLIEIDPSALLSADQRDMEADRFASALGVLTIEGAEAAFYVPSTDRVHMPAFAHFRSARHYYSTLFHELGHATMHRDRCDRRPEGVRGGESYAREELIAELTSVFTMMDLGLAPQPTEDNAAYLKSWIKRLRSDGAELRVAAGAAQKAHRWMLSKQIAEIEKAA